MRTQRPTAAFTLLELLVVIAIIGILVAIALPNLSNFKPNTMAAGTRQMLDDLGRARQLAISQRTPVFMVIVPTNFWNTPFYLSLPQADKDKADKVLDKQFIGYTFLSLRTLGDQPGRSAARIYNSWRTLPDGIIIPLAKFGRFDPSVTVMTITNNLTPYQPLYYVKSFLWTNTLPFPLETSGRPGLDLPYIGFNHLGQLIDANEQLVQEDELIPLALGSAGVARDPNTKIPAKRIPSFSESPPGNAYDAYTVVRIDKMTGRARIEKQEVQ